jgi:hypothetical protein
MEAPALRGFSFIADYADGNVDFADGSRIAQMNQELRRWITDCADWNYGLHGYYSWISRINRTY